MVTYAAYVIDVSRDADPSLVNPLSAASAGLLLDKHYQVGVDLNSWPI